MIHFTPVVRLISAVVVSLALLLSLNSLVAASGGGSTYNLTNSWTVGVSDGANGSDLRGITIDSSGNIYVAEKTENQVVKFSSSGIMLATIGNNQLYWPHGVAVDKSGNIYVADSYNNRIVEFNSNGVLLRSWNSYNGTNFNSPGDIIFDPSGNIYVADTCNNCIVKFDSAFNWKGTWTNSMFYYPYAIASDTSGNVYVANEGNNSVQVFNPDGSPSTLVINSQFNGPEGIAVDSSGNVYVGDSGNNCVQKFDSNGNFVTLIGSSQLSNPFGVAVDSSGNVFVADRNNYRIVEYTPSISSQSQQTITFGALSNKVYGDPNFSISASASSGLPVSFSASGPCTISGNTVHLTGLGICTITAHQAGNSDYYAAPDIVQSFKVTITYSKIEALISQFVTQQGIANSMISKIDNAKAAQDKGNANAKAGMINAFINEVQAQTGKAISSDNANLLITLAKAL